MCKLVGGVLGSVDSAGCGEVSRLRLGSSLLYEYKNNIQRSFIDTPINPAMVSVYAVC